mmetsp:Transcript_10432/g.20106  ORF Transcript_10432/g.20106 Transcript_10432/m.20106 type:complete len:117 (+) Transcript_10432:24-374(+)
MALAQDVLALAFGSFFVFAAMTSRRPTLALLLLAAVGAWLLSVQVPLSEQTVFVSQATTPTLRSTASKITGTARDPNAVSEEWQMDRSERFDDDSTKKPKIFVADRPPPDFFPVHR